MNFKEFGTILFVENYDACIDFYKHRLQMDVRNVKESLVTFNVSGGYLMVEQGGFGSASEKNRQQNPTVLRFDTASLDEAVSTLEKRGVNFIKKRIEFEWGTIAVLLDPDGNRIEIGEINETSGSYRRK
ncbi:VOC family protein [Lentibacillus salicampi]|uniref:Glyoxalase/bleomycin resistance/dioxygenase family protein n=1 Tax=Lentibacillus salicampi TaxID=175306 RepID=A0A4Y9A9Z4_9BACI|nr:VOC family protein [Lentibacillus salicampi]TFJ92718.1 glyoxalase/bleomycin resistance/dioxygenase family protein [Lentibacillus salicampi]